MAVAIEFVNVIVRKSAVERCMPGGLDGFAACDLPNFTEDEHLVRVGFMSTGEAFELVHLLETAGVRADELAIVTHEPDSVPAWLEAGARDDTACCWLRGAPVGDVARAEPGFALMVSLDAREQLERVLARFGAHLILSMDNDDGQRCTRDGAELLLHILENRPSRGYVLLTTRLIARRTHARADAALIRAFAAELEAVTVVRRL